MISPFHDAFQKYCNSRIRRIFKISGQTVRAQERILWTPINPGPMVTRTREGQKAIPFQSAQKWQAHGSEGIRINTKTVAELAFQFSLLFMALDGKSKPDMVTVNLGLELAKRRDQRLKQSTPAAMVRSLANRWHREPELRVPLGLPCTCIGRYVR
jgi:hypothetical protein